MPDPAPAPSTSNLQSTRGDNSLESNKSLYQIASRLQNAITLMDKYVLTLKDEKASKRAREHVRSGIKNTLTPLMAHAAQAITVAAQKLAPIPAVKVYHERHEKKRAREMVDENDGRVLPEKRMIDEYLSTMGAQHIASNEKSLPLKKRKVIQAKKLPTAVSKMPVPKVGNQYSPMEAMAILGSLECGKIQGKVVQMMVDRRLVPISRAVLYSWFREFSLKKPIPKEWRQEGRPPLMEDNEIKQLALSWEENQGREYQLDDIDQALRDNQKKKAINAGYLPSNIPESYSPTTLNNYRVEFCSQANISIVGSSIKKSLTRFAAEHSIRGSVLNAAIMAAFHFITVDTEDLEIRNEIKRLDPEIGILYNLASKALGDLPVRPVKPELIFSTDDTTVFIYEGKQNKKDKWSMVTKSSLAGSGTKSCYSLDDGSNMNGLRIKMTFTFSAAGTCAPLFFSVCGLTEQELPGESGFLHIEVPGLCVGGAGVNVGVETKGHIFFMRSEKGAQVTRFEYYHDKVLVPFINLTRKEFCKFNVDAGTAIPVEDTAVSWCDGDLSEVASIASNVDKFVENKIICNKQNAARSGVEQPADLAKVFSSLKYSVNRLTAKDKSMDTHLMKRRITEAFNSDKLKFLSLKPNHKKAIIDFVSILPTAATTAATCDNITHGFKESGVIDKVKCRYPVLQTIIQTCRRKVTTYEYDLIEKALPSLIRAVHEEGMISEELFDKWGFEKDRDAKGREVLRDAGISQESYQRSKCLTHPYQKDLRKQRIKELRMKQKKRLEVENSKHNESLAANRAAIEKLKNILQTDGYHFAMGANHHFESHLHLCKLHHYAKLSCLELDAIICAHDETILKKKDLPKKGSITEAEQGVRNKILLAYNCRGKINLKEAKCLHDLSSFHDDEHQDSEGDYPTIPLITLEEDAGVMPSQLLRDQEWVNRIKSLFDMEKSLHQEIEVTDTLIEKADLLARMLKQRFKYHVNSRIKNASQRTQRTMKLAFQNLGVTAAYMVLANHVKGNLKCLQESDCLLATNTNNFLPCSSFPRRQGAYLFYDNNRGLFIRSGKVTGQVFEERILQHKKCAMDPIASSHFYFVYPSEESIRAEKRDKQGTFEMLSAVIAAGFDPSSDLAQSVNRNWNDGGVLILDQDNINHIKSSMKKKNMQDIEKFQAILAYQFELAYDLAISPNFNVSRSPGFESFLGVFGGEE